MSELKGNEKRVYEAIPVIVRITTASIVNRTGLSSATVRKYMKSLGEKGLLYLDNGRGRGYYGQGEFAVVRPLLCECGAEMKNILPNSWDRIPLAKTLKYVCSERCGEIVWR